MRLDFISAGAAQAAVAALAAQRGIEVAGSFGAVGAMRDKFLAGEACDVLILARAQIEALAAEGRISAAPCADLGSVRTGIALRADDARPRIQTEDDVRNAFLGADALYIPDPVKSTAGIHVMKVLDLLGIRADMEARIRAFPNGATAMRALAAVQGGGPAGCTQKTEILATAGVAWIAPLMGRLELATVYTAAAALGASPEAREFVAALGGKTAAPMRRSAGFDTC